MIRNITFIAEEESAIPSATQPVETILRTRHTTVSPAEEFQLRPGQTRPISNELAAAILSFKGRATVENRGVVVERKDIGGRFVYFHEDSIVINDFSCREKKFYYVINRIVPDILHLLDETGAYVESLPLRERPAVLDNEAQAREMSRNKTVISRAATRLQQLHAEDTRERIAEIQSNSREMQRVVQTLPAPAAQPVQPARSTHGEAAAAGTRRINDMRANRASSIALGRAVMMNRHESPAPSDDAIVEDWSASTRTTTTTTQTTVEQW